MTLIIEIKNNNIELAASILYSIPIGGAHPPRKYVSVLPSLTVCINNNDIIRQPNAPTKLSSQDNVLLLSTINIGAINIGVITCKIGKWLISSRVPCLISEAINS